MAISGGESNSLGVLGFGAEAEGVYRYLLRASGTALETAALELGRSAAEFRELIGPLVEAGLVRLDGELLTAAPPEAAVGRLIAAETARLLAVGERLTSVRELIPQLRADHRDTPRSGDQVIGEVIETDAVPRVWAELAASVEGPVRLLRPDQWALPSSPAYDVLLADVARAGREVLAIYPARALSEAPKTLQARAAAGEQIRIVAELPARLGVFGRSAALVPEQWGGGGDRLILVRQPAMVSALGELFARIWDRAVVVPGSAHAHATGAGAGRALLLEQLAMGRRDEHIAGVLGVSLRTVRRRISDLQTGLGVASRFQAGVEAVRRGWL